MPSAPLRAILGFVAGAISVAIFHQGILELFHLAGMAPQPWSMQPVPPLGVPRVLDLCFWGGSYGIFFGLLLPRIRIPLWIAGILLGFVAASVSWLVVAPLKGLPLGYGWHPDAVIRSLVINGGWGLGVGLILPLMIPAAVSRVRRRMATG